MIKLQLSQKSQPLRVVQIDRFPCTIGRAAENQISIHEPSVSTQHAVISKKPEGFVIEDLGSTNGLLIHGVKTQKIVLSAGISFKLGEVQIEVLEVARVPEKKIGQITALASHGTRIIERLTSRIRRPRP